MKEDRTHQLGPWSSLSCHPPPPGSTVQMTSLAGLLDSYRDPSRPDMALLMQTYWQPLLYYDR